MQITIQDDFNLEKISNSGQCFRVKRFENGMYRFICENRFLYIRHREGPHYEVDCSPKHWHDFWYDYFDLGRNYRNIRKTIPPEDVCLTEAALAGKGIRILRQNPWEMLITFIISQRKSIPAIKHAVELLSSGFGDPIHTDHETVYGFPDPQHLLGLSEDKLRQCGLGYRAPYIRDAVTKVALGHIDLDQLHEYQDTDLLDTLKTVCGVGNKVAGCISLFAYGRTALAPVDTWISRTIDEKYHGVNPFPQYGNAAGIMQQYIFYYAQTHKQEFAKSHGRKNYEKQA